MAPAAPDKPDGGLGGWVKVGCMVVVQGCCIGLQYSFGIMFVVLLDAFGESRGATAWVASLSTGMLLLASVLAGVTVSRTSARFCVLLGGLCTFVGMILSSFATSLWHLYLSFGILVGLGHALLFPAGIITLNGWFEKRRGLANGVGTTGVGIGTLIFGSLTKQLVESLGWRAAFRVLSLSAVIATAAGLNYRSRAEVAVEGSCCFSWRWLAHPSGHAQAAAE
eukprot:COSAG06_NODE_12887_length_1316_cov_1.485620_1_plen_223_part_00